MNSSLCTRHNVAKVYDLNTHTQTHAKSAHALRAYITPVRGGHARRIRNICVVHGGRAYACTLARACKLSAQSSE
eukprot:6182659-Pleurochrysis_carterae.AAC.1